MTPLTHPATNPETGECGDPACPCHEFCARSSSQPPRSPSLTYYGHVRLDTGQAESPEPEAKNVPESPLTQNRGIPVLADTPDFSVEWDEAPRDLTRYTERECAEYFFLRGVHAGEKKQMLEENRILQEMMRRRDLEK